MPVIPVTAVIITKNEAENIGRCIQSLNGLVEEVLVIDSQSKDETVRIARQLGARVIVTEWQGYAQTKNFGNTHSSNDWILSIDADEVLSDELIASIRAIPLQPNTVYAMNRLNNFCGDWIYHSGWYPDWKVRIFNRQTTYWIGDFVHEKLKFSEKVVMQKLSGQLLHYTYTNLEDHWQRIERYSTLSAKALFAEKKKPSWLQQKGGPIFRFFKTYILQRGFLDGKNGWIISTRAAQMVRMKYEKLNKLYQNHKVDFES